MQQRHDQSPRPEHAAGPTAPERRARSIDRYALAHDASHFLLIPESVAVPRNAGEVAALMASCAQTSTPLTFRSGGTSLSGQSVTEGVLADVRTHFTSVDVLDGGARVRVGPGATVRQVNARLARYRRKFGPDPASEAACTIGGVIANNSSGMHCGIDDNSYRTLESMTVVLSTGSVIDTSAPDADTQLLSLEPAIHAGLLELSQRVRGNPESMRIIGHQFAMKNTMGYSLNALVDFDSPVRMLEHLLIGGEGTLGFVAEAQFRTIPLRPQIATGLLIFPDLRAAASALPALTASGAATVELMDARSLKVGQQLSGAPAAITGLTVGNQAALLVEYMADTPDALQTVLSAAMESIRRLDLHLPASFTEVASERAALWRVRKGLYASVAGARPPGTTALLEDVVVPVPALARTCQQLNDLFDTHGYTNTVIFGHAKDGNIHFMLTDQFELDTALERYRLFTEDLVELILGEGGSLKAEHGTGRVMAPFVARQFGDELYDVMCAVKKLLDPENILNPGVIISDDPELHLKHIKKVPLVGEEVDTCVSCGYCEPVCPSRSLTLTPRQRIVTLRSIEQAKRDGNSELAANLERDYTYDAVETCAVDGMCQTACPVGIDTGSLVKRLRAESSGRLASAGWSAAAGHWGTVARAAGTAMTLTAKSPPALIQGPNRLARSALGNDTVPLHSPELPRGGASRSRSEPSSTPDAVYFSACVHTMFGPAVGDTTSHGTQVSFEELCGRAGIVLRVPRSIDALCCGTPWSSKGHLAGLATMRKKTVAALREATDDGALPIVCDASSCTEGLRQAVAEHNLTAGTKLTIIDVVEFAAERIVPKLGLVAKVDSLALHPTCSSTRMGINAALMTVAEATATQVTVPESWGCCAYAGDRGMLHPELTASATAQQAAEVKGVHATAHASCNRTCELGMTRATGEPYRHVLELLAEATRPS